jgi:hypothetical protein
MAISMTKKQEIIQQLLASKTKAYQAEVKLLLKRKPEEADKIKDHGKELSRKIDDLISQTMSDWIGNGDTIINDVKSINSKIQRSIRGVQNDVNVANNIVKMVGFIDEVVEIVDGIT